MIECTDDDLKGAYATLVQELKSFNESMLKKPRLVAITKMDLADDKIKKAVRAAKFGKDIQAFPISSATGAGLKELVAAIWKKISAKKIKS
jgi:GTP-binding protein